MITDCQEQHSSEDVARRLQSGQRTLRRIRWRVGAGMIGLGLVLGAVFLITKSTFLRVGSLNAFGIAYPLTHLSIILAAISFHGRFVALSLAPLADCLSLTRFVLVLDILVMLGDDLEDSIFIRKTNPHVFGSHAQILVPILTCLTWLKRINHVIFFVGIARAMLIREASRMQEFTWRVIAVYEALSLAGYVLEASIWSYMWRDFSPVWWAALISSVGLLLALHSSWRRSLQAALSRAAEASASRRAAAGIAGLLGDETTKVALARASAHFRCILLSDLQPADVVTNTPSPALFERTAPASLNAGCDAFVSHSWSDDDPAKWAALQKWCSDFEARHGREPRLWFDKCCVDQSNIDDNLRCLPVFLSGCDTLLVLCGETYLSRLWCVMELFTFAHMDSANSRIEFVPLLRPGREASDAEHISRQLAAFDSSRCRSSKPEEEQKFFGIIKAAFGSLEEFNSIVQSILYSPDLMTPGAPFKVLSISNADLEVGC